MVRGRNAWMFCLFLIGVASPRDGVAVDVLAGDVSGTWAAADSPFDVQGSIRVPGGATLVIEPGVTVTFAGAACVAAGDCDLTVEGTLHAGTDAGDAISIGGAGIGSIIFDGVAAGEGSGYIKNGSITTAGAGQTAALAISGASASPLIQDTQITGSASAGVSVHAGASPTLLRVTLDTSASHGLLIDAAVPSVSDCVFSGNGTAAGSHFPISGLTFANVNALGTNTYVGNATDALPIPGGPIPDGALWKQQAGVAFVPAAGLSIAADAAVTWDAGVVVKLPVGTGLTVLGTWTTSGVAANQVVLTSIHDDDHGGDSGGDGVSSGTPGDCTGVHVDGGTADLTETLLRFGGSANGNLRISGATGSLVLSGGTLRDSATAGLTADAGATLDVASATIDSNAGHGIDLTDPTVSLTRITGCSIVGNGTLEDVDYPIHGLSFTHLGAVTGNSYTGNITQILPTPGGDVAASTWPAQGIPYRPAGSLNIPTATLVTWQAGAIIDMPDGTHVTVLGTLDTSGTAAQPVLLTGVAWDQLHFDGGGGTLSDLQISGAGHNDVTAAVQIGNAATPTFQDASVTGSASAGVYVHTGATPTLLRTTLDTSASHGLLVDAATPAISDCVFSGNGTLAGSHFPISGLTLANLNALGTNTYVDNVTDALPIPGGAIANLSTWSKQTGVSFTPSTSLTIAADATVTWSSGVVVKMPASSSLLVNGTWTSNGAVGDPVVLTCLDDDEYGGDSNGDGATTGAPGAWSGVHVDGGTATLTNTLVRFGGGPNGNLRVSADTASVAMTGGGLTDSGTHGLVAETGATVSLDGTTFRRNAGHGIWVANPDVEVTQIANCDFGDNGDYAIATLSDAQIAGLFNNTFSNTDSSPDFLAVVTTDGIDINTVVWESFDGGPVFASDTVNVDCGSGDVIIPAGNALFLAAGTEMVFTEGPCSLIVYGAIYADGTAADPVLFRGSDTSTTWGELLIDGGTAVLTHSHFTQAGATVSAAVRVANGADVYLQDCTIDGSLSAGLQLEASTSATVLHGAIRNSATHAISLATASAWVEGVALETNGTMADSHLPVAVATLADVVSLGPDIVYTDNVTQYIPLPSGTIPNDSFWTGQAVPLRPAGDLSVANATTVVWGPGLTVHMPVDAALTVDGNLYTGDSDPDTAEVLLTSIDDSASAEWGGIYVPASSRFDATRTLIRYAGGTNGLVRANGSGANVYLRDCALSHSSSVGVTGESSARLEIVDSAIIHTASHSVLASQTNVTTVISGTTFGFAGNYAIYGLDYGQMGNISANMPHADDTAGAFLGAVVVNTGTISLPSSRTWRNAGLPWVLRADYELWSNRTLTVEAGAVFKLDGNRYIYIGDGVFNVNGTADQQVYFTSLLDDEIAGDTNGDAAATAPAAGNWMQVRFNNNDSTGYPATGTLNYATFRYGGSSSGNVYLVGMEATRPTFNNCVFELSASAGVRLYGYDSGDYYSGYTSTFSNCTFRKNTGSGLYSAPRTNYDRRGHPRINGCTFQDNGSWAIDGVMLSNLNYIGNVAPNTFENVDDPPSQFQAVRVVQSTIRQSGTWNPGGVVVISGNPTFWDNATVSVAAGTVFKLEADSGIQMYDGVFNVNGTAEEPVYFTSIHDDSVAGDTNANADETAPQPGDWRHLRFNNNDSTGYPAHGTLNHTIFRYGGSSAANVYLIGMEGTRPTFNNCVFELSGSAGVRLYGWDSGDYYNGYTSAFNECIFRDNTAQGVYSTPRTNYDRRGHPRINGCTFQDNGSWAIDGLMLSNLNQIGNTAPNVFQNVSRPEDQHLAVRVVSGSVRQSGSWAADAPIVISGNPSFWSNPTITVASGAVFKLETDSGIQMYDGVFNVNGTADAPVYFTSIHDDSVGGDTNANGADTTPAPGDWRYVRFNNDDNGGYPANGTLDYATFRYGGGSVGNVYLVGMEATRPTFNNCVFEHSGAAGVRLYGWDSGDYYNGYTSAFNNCTFRNNAAQGIYSSERTGYDRRGHPRVNGCTFQDNGSWAIDGLMLSNLNQIGNTAANVFQNVSRPADQHLAVRVVSGSVRQSGSWAADAPIVVSGNPSFWSNPTITVAPGAIFKFHADSGIQMYDGVFNVGGTTTEPVYFTSIHDDSVGGDTNANGSMTTPAAGDWRYVRFNNDDNAGYPANGTINYATFRYGGGSVANVFLVGMEATRPTFNNCTFSDSASHGVHVYGWDSTAYYNGYTSTFNDCMIRDNAGRGIYITPRTGYTRHGHPRINGCTFQDNGSWAIDGLMVSNLNHIGAITPNTCQNVRHPPGQHLGFRVTTGEVRYTGTWPAECPIVIAANLPFWSNRTITVPAGAVLKFEAGHYLGVWDGRLNLNGTQDNPIYVTSIDDDTVAGDTDGDGDATLPQPGSWRAIIFNNDDNGGYPAYGNIDHTVFRYGGSVSGLLEVRNNPTWITISNSVFDNSATSGVRMTTASTVNVSASVFRNVAAAGVYCDGNADGLLETSTFAGTARGVDISGCQLVTVGGTKPDRNDIVGNTQFGVRNVTSAYTTNAQYNYWGDKCGPNHPSNPNAPTDGDVVSDYVDFSNWVTLDVDAGPDLQVEEGQTVTLQSTSYDPDDPTAAELSYQWTQIDATGYAVAPDTSADLQPVLRPEDFPDLHTDITLEYEVVASATCTGPDPDTIITATDTVSVLLKAKNEKPVADAGADREVARRELVVADGSASWDINGDSITAYTWTVAAGGEAVTLTDATTAHPYFTAPDVTDGQPDKTVVLELKVTDARGLQSDPASVVFTVKGQDSGRTVSDAFNEVGRYDYKPGENVLVIGETFELVGTGLDDVTSVRVNGVLAGFTVDTIGGGWVRPTVPAGAVSGPLTLELNGVEVTPATSYEVVELLAVVNADFVDPATGEDYSTLEVFEAQTGALLAAFEVPWTAAVDSFPTEISPSGRRLLLARANDSGNETLVELDLVTGQLEQALPARGIDVGNPTAVHALELVDEQTAVLVSGCTGQLRVVDLSTNSTAGSPLDLGATEFGTDLAVLPRAELALVTNDQTSTVSVVDISDPAALSVVQTLELGSLDGSSGGGSGALGIGASADERWVLVANSLSDTVSVIEHTGGGSLVARGPALPVGLSPKALDVSEDGTVAAVLNDSAVAGGDTVTVLDLTGTRPAVVGESAAGMEVDAFTAGACNNAINTALIDVSYTGDRVFVGTGYQGSSDYYEVVIPEGFPAISTLLNVRTTTTGPSQGLALQPGRGLDEVGPVLVAVSLHDHDGQLAIGPGDTIQLHYNERISDGDLASGLQTSGDLDTVLSQVGVLVSQEEATLSASSVTLQVADHTITVILGGDVAGELPIGTELTPVAGSVDDTLGNPLTDTTAVAMSHGFEYGYRPIFSIAQAPDNEHVTVHFTDSQVGDPMAVTGADDPSCWRLSFNDGALQLPVVAVDTVDPATYVLELQLGTQVGTEYTLEESGTCQPIMDAVDALPVNYALTPNRFVAIDVTAPSFAGILSAVDSATLGADDDAVDIAWAPATDNAPGEITYLLYHVHGADQDPFAIPAHEVVPLTNETSHQFDDLIKNEPYRFAVRAQDASGHVDGNTVILNAIPTDSVPPYWVPGEPVGVISAEDTNECGTVQIRFGEAEDHKSPPVRYNLYVSPDTGTLYDAPRTSVDWDVSDGETEMVYSINALTDGLLHYFAVRAVDAQGNEEANTIRATATPGCDLQPPVFTGIDSAVDDASDGTVVLYWPSAEEAENPPVSYRIYQHTDPAQVFTVLLKDAAPSLDAVTGLLTESIAGLTNDTSTCFGVVASDAVGNEEPGTDAPNTQCVTPTRDAQPPTFAGITEASATGTSGEVVVRWSLATEDKSTPVTYAVYVSTDTGIETDASLLFHPDHVARTLTGTATQVSLTGLTATNTYFGVRATDARGNAETNTEWRSTAPAYDIEPPVFGGIQGATPYSSGSVYLSWASATESLTPPVTYNVYWMVAPDPDADLPPQDPDLFATPQKTGVLETATCEGGRYCVTGLSNGVTYWFGLLASDSVPNLNERPAEPAAFFDPPFNAVKATPVDGVAPVISSVLVTPTPPAKATVGDTVILTFTVDEDLLAAPSVSIELYDTPPEEPLQQSVDMTLVSQDGHDFSYIYTVTGAEQEGTRSISISADDLASPPNNGSASAEVQLDFSIDTKAPRITFETPVDGDELNDATPQIVVVIDDTWGGAEPDGSGVDCSTLRLSIDNVVKHTGCQAYDPATSSGWKADEKKLYYLPSAELSGGSHLLTVSASDLESPQANSSGNVSINFTVVPPARLVVNPATASLAEGQTQSFTASWEASLDDCQWDAGSHGSLEQDTGSQVVYQPEVGAQPGTYVLSVTCTDGELQQTAKANIEIVNLLSLTPEIVNLQPNGTQRFEASSDYADASYCWQISGGGTLQGGPCEVDEILLQAGLHTGQFVLTVQLNRPGQPNIASATATVNIIPGDYPIGRAIVVAGGSMADHLWPDSRQLSRFAYAALQSRGFDDESIFFMTQGGDVDIDGDGQAEVDNIAGPTALADLQDAIVTWAQQDAGAPLFLYLVDHGGTGSMWLGDTDGDGTADEDELLLATELGAWLDQLQSAQPGTPIVLLYEACKSGSFLAELAGLDRVVMSTAGHENAVIALDGNISFSQYFLAAVGQGKTVGEAFNLASAAMGALSAQVPRLDDDGDGSGNGPLDGDRAAGTYIGYPFAGDDNVLDIDLVTAEPLEPDDNGVKVTEPARLRAVVTGPDVITEVYALLLPPDYEPPQVSDQFETPQLDLQRLDLDPALDPDTGEPVAGVFEATTAGLEQVGTYRFLVYASDSQKRQALPRQASVLVYNPPPRLLSLSPADQEPGVRIDTAISFVLEDLVHGVKASATRLRIDADDAGEAGLPLELTDADLIFSGSQYHLTVRYTPEQELPSGKQVRLTIETLDLATPAASVIYETRFTTAGKIRVVQRTPEADAKDVAADTTVALELLDESGFGINPVSIVVTVNGMVADISVTKLSTSPDPDRFGVLHMPDAPFDAGSDVHVTVDAQDAAGHGMSQDHYKFTIAYPPEQVESNPPTASFTSPLGGTTDVDLDAEVRFTVQDDTKVDLSTVRIAVEPVGGTRTSYAPSSAALQCVGNDLASPTSVDCTLRRTYPPGTSIQLELDAQDDFSNVMATVSSSFSTRDEIDIDPPVISGQTPAPNATDVPVEAGLAFSVDDAGSGVSSGSITLEVDLGAGAGFEAIAAEDFIRTDPTGQARTVVVTYARTWPWSRAVTVRVTAEDQAGNTTEGLWSFRTDSGIRVTDTSPVHQARGVPIDATVQVDVSLTPEAQDQGVNIDINSLRLLLDSASVTPQIDGDPSHFVMTYDPGGLTYNKNVRMTVQASNLDGFAMPTFQSTFTTEQDVEPPYLVGLSPAPDASGVAVTTAITFDILDDGVGVSQGSITVQLDTHWGIEVHRAWTAPKLTTTAIPNGLSVSAQPTQLLRAGELVTVTINATDTEGNRLPQVLYTFTAGAEYDPPTATFLQPLCPERTSTGETAQDQHPGIAPDAKIVAVLADAGAGIDVGSIELLINGQTPEQLGASLDLEGDSHELTLTLTHTFAANETVTVTLTAQDLSPSHNRVVDEPREHVFNIADGTDSDSDGLPDEWEACYFADGTDATPDEDPDGDGAPNALEYADGTHPRDPNDASSVSQDAYEIDDTMSDVQFVDGDENLVFKSKNELKPGQAPQRHNFHQPNDSDWVWFHALANQTYRIAATDLQARSEPVLKLFAEDGLTRLSDSAQVGGSVEIVYETGPTDEDLLVQIMPTSASGFGAFTGYDLGVYFDAVPPSITAMSPANGARITLRQPELRATVTDAASGVVATSVQGFIDGIDCTGTFPAEPDVFACTVADELEPGAHIFELRALDVAGNEAVGQTVFAVTDFAIVPSSVSLQAEGSAETLAAEGGEPPVTFTATGGQLNVLSDTEVEYLPGSDAGDFAVEAIDSMGRRALAAVQIRPVLAVQPALANVGPSEPVVLNAVYEGEGQFTWSTSHTEGTLSDTQGQSVTYTSGLEPGVYPVTVTETTSGNQATAVINVLSTNVGQAVILASTAGLSPAEALAVQRNAEYAYQAMFQRGLSRERIHFYTGNPSAEFDGDENGLFDDIDGELSTDNVWRLFETELPPLLNGSSPLVVYMVGGNSTASAFSLNGSESMTYAELDGLVDGIEQDVGLRHLALLADTDNGGRIPAVLAGASRVLISSTSAEQPAVHDIEGQLSFSHAFFNRVFVGESVGEAFTAARGTIAIFGSEQVPLIDDDGNGLPNEKSDGPLASVTYIGEPGLGSGGGPVIAAHTDDVILSAGSQQTLFASVLSSELLAAVEVTLMPPHGLQPNVILAMVYDDVDDRYELTYDGFTQSGVYRIVYSARDIRGRVSRPVESTVTTAGPHATGLYPAPGHRGIPTNTLLFFTLVDPNEDLNLSTLSVRVDDTEIVSDCAAEGTDPKVQRMTCDPQTTWPLLAEVSVELGVSNVAGAAMTPLSYTFTITDAVDVDADGLPDDFQHLLGPLSAPADDTDGDGVDNATEFGDGLNPIEIYPPDAYEDDDASSRATVALFGDGQAHSFHDLDDEDWLTFNCEPQTYYEVWTEGLAPRADTVLEVYRADAITLLRHNDDYDVTSPHSRLLAACFTAGPLLVRVRQLDGTVFGPDTDYTVVVEEAIAAVGSLYGFVTDAVTEAPVTTATISVEMASHTLTTQPYPDGAYMLDLLPGEDYRVVVEAVGYVTAVIDHVDLLANAFTERSVQMQPQAAADTDGDGMPDAWEDLYGLNKNVKDADGDADGDRWTNIYEFYNGTDPSVSNAPVVDSPDNESDVLEPVTLTVSKTPGDDTVLTYYFTLMDDNSSVIEQSGAVAQGDDGKTAWSPTKDLEQFTHYRWEAYASDGVQDTHKALARFQVVPPPTAPPVPLLLGPAEASVVQTHTPSLEVKTVADLNREATEYRFEIYDTATLEAGSLVVASDWVPETPTSTIWLVSQELPEIQTYYWRVRAQDAAGYVGDWSATGSFTVDLPKLPPAPVWVTPLVDDEVLQSNPPTLVAEGVATDEDGEAVSYAIVLDVDPAFGSGQALQATDLTVDGNNRLSWTLLEPLDPAATYHAQVVGSDGTSQGPAATIRFTVVPPPTAPPVPTLLSPPNLSAVDSLRPSLEVSTVIDVNGDATQYEFEVYPTEQLDPASVLLSSGWLDPVGSSTTWPVDTDLADEQTYYWRARARDAGGLQSDWTLPWAFIVDLANTLPDAPIIAVPDSDGDVLVDNPPTLIFTGAHTDLDGDTLTYDLVLDADPAFASPDRHTVTGLSPDSQNEMAFTPSDTLDWSQTFYLRVVAFDGEGYSDAATRSFSVLPPPLPPPVPVLQAPADGATVDSLTPTLQVQTSEDVNGDATTYQIELYTDASLDAASLVTTSDWVQEQPESTTWTVDVELTDQTTYHWRARAQDTGGLTSDWSAASVLHIALPAPANTPPPTPVFVVPANDGDPLSDNPPIFVIEGVQTDDDGDPVTYYLQVDDDSSFLGSLDVSASNLSVDDNAQIIWALEAPLPAGATYWVQAIATDGAAFSDAVSLGFTVPDAPSWPPPAPELAAPADGAFVDTHTPALELLNVVDPNSDEVTYQFEVYATAELPAEDLLVASDWMPQAPVRTGWTVSSSLEDMRTYHWRARAQDTDGMSSDWSEVWSFTVETGNALPPPPTILEPAEDDLVIGDNPPTFVLSGVALDDDEHSVTYDLVLDTDRTYDSVDRKQALGLTVDADGLLHWTPDGALDPDTAYWLRALATDGLGFSPPAERTFRTAPPDEPVQLVAPELIAPIDQASVTELQPTLIVATVLHPQAAPVSYELELYQGVTLEQLVANAAGVAPEGNEVRWQVPEPLQAGEVFSWRARARDEAGNVSPWSEVEMFNVVNMKGSKRSGCKCDVGAPLAGGSPLYLLVLLAGWLALRRQRRTHGACDMQSP